MSRTLRRPMFRGGRVSSYGTGIASGLADGGMPPKRGLVTGPGGYAGEFATGWNRIWGSGASGTGTTPTGGQIVDKAAKTLESRMAKGVRGAGRWLRNPGTGISGWAMRNFPTALRMGAYGLPVYGALKGSGAQLELIDKASEKGMLDEFGESIEFADGRILPSYEFAEKVEPSEYTVESGVFEEEDKIVEKPEHKVPDAIKGEDPIYQPRVVDSDTAEPVELTAEEIIREKKELFADLLGADKARGQDISAMLMSASSKLLGEGATVKSAFSEFLGEEAKRPGKLEKIKETAGVLAINDYIAGNRSKENLAQTLGMKKSIIDYDYETKSKIINVTDSDNFRQGLGKIAAKYKLDPTGASALKTYFAEVLGLKLHPVTPSYTLEKFKDKGWKDLKVGFNLVTPKGEGKMIIEKKPDGTIDIKTNLVI